MIGEYEATKTLPTTSELDQKTVIVLTNHINQSIFRDKLLVSGQIQNSGRFSGYQIQIAHRELSEVS